MNQSDRARILATGPRNFEEATVIRNEFARAAHACLVATSISEIYEALSRLDEARVWLQAWRIYRDQEVDRRAREAQPIVIPRNLSTQENREFWDGVDRAALEVATWPEWKFDRPRAVAANGDGEPLDSAKQSDHNEGTD